MNSVAGQLVATMLNSSFTASSGNSLTATSSSDNFSDVFSKVSSSNSVQSSESTETVVAETATEAEAVTSEVQEQSVTETEEATAQSEATKVEEKVTEAVEEVKDEVTDLTEDVTDETAALIEASIEQISQILGITEEELLTVMDDLDLNLESLSEGEGLTALIQEVQGIENQAEFLVSEEAAEAYKAISEELQTLTEDFDGDMEVLDQAFTEVIEKMGENVQTASAEVQEESNPLLTDLQNAEDTALETGESTENNLEIEDLRTGDQTTKDSQQNGQNGQDQNMDHPSFGELMAQRVDTGGQTADVQAVDTAYVKLNEADIIDQIVTKAIVQLSDEKTSMELQLNPGNLGKVAVSLTAEQGLVKGQFVAENEAVKEMLETNMIQLKEQLEEQGIKVDKIEVALGNATDYFDQREQQQNQEQNSKSSKAGRIRRIMEGELADVTDITEQVLPDLVQTLDVHTVEYSA